MLVLKDFPEIAEERSRFAWVEIRDKIKKGIDKDWPQDSS